MEYWDWGSTIDPFFEFELEPFNSTYNLKSLPTLADENQTSAFLNSTTKVF